MNNALLFCTYDPDVSQYEYTVSTLPADANIVLNFPGTVRIHQHLYIGTDGQWGAIHLTSQLYPSVDCTILYNGVNSGQVYLPETNGVLAIGNQVLNQDSDVVFHDLKYDTVDGVFPISDGSHNVNGIFFTTKRGMIVSIV